MLLSDYYTYSVRDSQSGGGSHCRLCPAPPDQSPRPVEDIQHVLTQCVATAEVRETVMEKVMVAAALAKSNININKIGDNISILTQFLLDPCSMNLDNDVRVHVDDPAAPEIYTQARHLINGVHQHRVRKLKEIEKEKKP